ncbi:MAG: aldo/keto reductase, partial [Selenomonas sp.]|nr:aldo/keto reductase [Selenomonas sp.]
PHVIQLEAHPYCTEREVMERMAEYGTRLMGWYPLGHGDAELIKEPIFARLSEKYRKSPAQIILRWHTQMGFITIPGSKNPDHIRDNLNIFDFRLTVEEMSEIAEMDGKKKYYEPDNAKEEKYATMRLPFEESR